MPGIRPRTPRPATRASRTARRASCVVPGRLHISWQDDTTLKIDTDAGTQTRLLHFTGTPGGDPSWQGYSAAVWELAGADRGIWRRCRRGRRRRGGGVGPAGAGAGARGGRGGPPPRGGSLKVVTTRMKEGYLRKNGVPVQREHHPHRVPRSSLGNQRRRVVHGHDDCRGREVSGAVVHYEHAFQEGSRRLEVVSDTL